MRHVQAGQSGLSAAKAINKLLRFSYPFAQQVEHGLRQFQMLHRCCQNSLRAWYVGSSQFNKSYVPWAIQVMDPMELQNWIWRWMGLAGNHGKPRETNADLRHKWRANKNGDGTHETGHGKKRQYTWGCPWKFHGNSRPKNSSRMDWQYNSTQDQESG